jgi:hypothetical protein
MVRARGAARAMRPEVSTEPLVEDGAARWADGRVVLPAADPPDKLGEQIAWRIEEEVLAEGLAPGTVIGSEPELLERYGEVQAAMARRQDALRVVLDRAPGAHRPAATPLFVDRRA